MVQSDGASGGAFALLAVAVVVGFRWRRRLQVDDARLLGPVFAVVLVLNLVLSFAIPAVDAAAHLGGLVAGLLVAWVPAGWWFERVDAWVVGSFLGACAYGWVAVAVTSAG